VLDKRTMERLYAEMAPPVAAVLLPPKVQLEMVELDKSVENIAPPRCAWLPAISFNRENKELKAPFVQLKIRDYLRKESLKRLCLSFG